MVNSCIQWTEFVQYRQILCPPEEENCIDWNMPVVMNVGGVILVLMGSMM